MAVSDANKRARGEKARQEFEGTILETAVKALQKATSQLMLASEPASKEAVGYHYLNLAVTQIENEIKSYIQQGAEAASLMREAEEQEQQEPQAIQRAWVAPPVPK